MRRDDPALVDAALVDPASAAGDGVARQPLHFGDGLFGWYHPADAPARDCVAVLCAPIGPEYTRSHRTLRHLAQRLAEAGVAALRFDYHGVGDSAGEDDGPDRLGHWRRSVREAVREARALSGRQRVCLVGVRLGATLAALEAAPAGADMLVLWNPVVKGRAWVRELQATAMTAGTATVEEGGGIEGGGFRASHETLEALRAIDLAAAPPREARVLLVDRDDLAPNGALAQRLAREGIAHDRLTAPGWNDMMADHQFTIVPDTALAMLRDWIVRHAGEGRRPISESPLRFGPGGHLFGILARPPATTDKPAVLLLDAGSIHHVGPHRLYVNLARELARHGHASLRFDFEGIGDSVLRGPGRENHPYGDNAMVDLAAAIEALRAEHGFERVVLMGVCSGAYHAYQAGFRLREAPIERLVLVNPWTFAWREGMSLATTISHYGDVAAYGQAARNLERWKRLARGEVDVARIARVAATHALRKAQGRWAELREAVQPGSGSRLSREILEIGALGRRMHLILSDGEPAQAILETEAPRTVRRALRAGALTLERIRGGDHTFSREAHRDELVSRILRILRGAPER